MSYIHKGKALENGTIDPDATVTDATELTLLPEDDGFHVTGWKKGDFEWWYFDLLDPQAFCFLKIVMHIGTDPLRTKVYPQLAISVNTPEFSESYSTPYSPRDFTADTHQCDVTAGSEVRIYTESKDPLIYKINIDTGVFKCSLQFKGETEGWKPLGREMNCRMGRRKAVFSWVIPVPKAKVEGYFTYKGKKYSIQDAIGYHDHNYYNVSEEHALYIDQFIKKWYWGKGYAGNYSVVFMDTFSRINRTSSLLVVENNRIIHSSNNRIDCNIESLSNDPVLKTTYPEVIRLTSKDRDLPLRMTFDREKLLDRKDLIAEVNPVLRWLIRNTIAKPSYHGNLAKVKLTIKDKPTEGIGNFESMVFR